MPSRLRPRTSTAERVITAALTVGATARVTRLITRDDFPIKRVRDWALTELGPDAWFTKLIECPWCTGVWVSAPAVASAFAWGERPWWRALAAWMALSMVASAVVVNTEPH